MRRAGNGQRRKARGRERQMANSELRLVSPSIEYAESYREFHARMREENRPYIPGDLDGEIEDLESWLKALRGHPDGAELAKGETLPEYFWLVNETGRVLGSCHIWHCITDWHLREAGHVGYSIDPPLRGRGLATRMLELLLEKARRLGMDRLLLTCDRDNLASARVIEKCGGVLENEVTLDDGRVKKRYWVGLSV
ncbi:MAG: GNAT family N-acetyltransferase [Planctomycetota bacterium]|jgi:predicted acetyltransferase